jgi:spoIIIJ-associated protein
MSDRQEFYAATVEEAVDKASKALNVAPDRVRFEVLDQGSSGFLGIGTRDARIVVEHVSARGDAPYPEVDGARPESEYAAEERVMPSGDTSSEISRPLEDDGPADSEDPEDLIIAIDEFAILLVEAMGIDATVDVYDSGDAISVDIATQETGLLIGQKGETIDAIQYLLNVIIYKNRPFSKRIVVDSEGYRQRRVEAIQGMAHRTARRALREKRPLSLPPMSPAERRVVHLFLKENPRVTTSSEGEEENRRVVVNPV